MFVKSREGGGKAVYAGKHWRHSFSRERYALAAILRASKQK